jgi:hypothetical protein
MDLALEFGEPVEQLKQRMTEREFAWWAKRSATHWLPSRRVEWYLAQLAYMIAVTMGGAKDVSLSDFMLNLEPPTEEPEMTMDELKRTYGAHPKDIE